MTAKEKDKYGVSHKDVGAHILKSWNFPNIFVDAASEHGSLNVTSPYKVVIMGISTADLISTKLDATEGSSILDQQIQGFLPHIGLKESDVAYYKESFLDSMKDDPLFQECQNLFSLT